MMIESLSPEDWTDAEVNGHMDALERQLIDDRHPNIVAVLGAELRSIMDLRKQYMARPVAG